MPEICVTQFSTGTDKSANLDAATTMLRAAAEEGADIVVLPEFTMYNSRTLGPDFRATAESVDGPFVSRLSELARDLGLTVVAGMTERIPDDPQRVFNTLVAIDPAGSVAATYRKQHLFDAFGIQESSFIAHGPIGRPETFVAGGLRFGMQTCFDVRFPEVSRRIVDAGAEVLVLPTAWAPGPRKEAQLRTLACARAVENTVYVVAADQVPPEGACCAMVVDPTGSVIADVGAGPGRVRATLDAERVRAVREQIPTLALRRFTVVARDGEIGRALRPDRDSLREAVS